MATPAKHQFSVKDYYRMAETGVLAPESRVELIEGEIIDMSPIGPFHGSVVARLARIFNKSSNDRWVVWPQNALRLDEHSEPQPDVVLLKYSPDDYANQQPGPDDVILLVEVSDTTLAYDRDRKLSLYGRAEIPEVWIVNLADLSLEIYREPHFTGYSSKTILKAGDQAKPRAFPDVTIDVAALLKK
jgi:Uma2 family endonuclease